QILSATLIVALGSKLPTQAILTAAGLCYFTIIFATMWSQGARKLMANDGHVPPVHLAGDEEVRPAPAEPAQNKPPGSPT
ncbi:MAG TPA: hypothetical protein PLY80_18135, partial [Pseudomonadota bacterium]|nr:hypothetical protein [Pseudomonadota bacterium]